MIIKKEADRKFYNSETKKYITLNDMFLLIKQNLKIKIIDYRDSDITKDVVKKAIMTHCKDSDEALEIMYDYFNKEPVMVSDKFIVIDRVKFLDMKTPQELMTLLEQILKEERKRHLKSEIFPHMKEKSGMDFELVKINNSYNDWILARRKSDSWIYILLIENFDCKTELDKLIKLRTFDIPNDCKVLLLHSKNISNCSEKVAKNLLTNYKILIVSNNLDPSLYLGVKEFKKVLI